MDILETASALVRRTGGFFVCWTGVVYDSRHHLVRMDKVFLNLLHMRDGRPLLQRIAGSVQKRADGERYLLYSRSPLYHITDGARAGHIVAAGELRKGELYRPSGVCKELRYSPETGFSLARKGDLDLLRTLRSLPGFVRAEDMTKTLPPIYLTCPESNTDVYLRNAPAALFAAASCMTLAGSVPAKTAALFFQRNRRLFGIPLGDRRIGYPSEFVHGRGVLAAMVIGERRAFGFWQHVDDIVCKLAHVEVR